MLTEKQKQRLLDIAESSILGYLEGKKVGPGNNEVEESELMSLTGAFVSVYVNNKLRGCIGTFSDSIPLADNVKKMAVSAAFHDSRFKSLSKNDTDNLRIEISVLTPRKRIISPEEIEIGKHGIYMVSGEQRGTLLPQVALNNNWNSIQLLEYCAEHKVGITKTGWKSAELYTYEAIVFTR